jgi:hypothetical protein
MSVMLLVGITSDLVDGMVNLPGRAKVLQAVDMNKCTEIECIKESQKSR